MFRPSRRPWSTLLPLQRKRRSLPALAWLTGAPPLTLGAQASPWVLARSRCRFQWVGYEGLPADERRNRLTVALQAWAPFEHSGLALVDTPQGCMVWAWDAAALAEDAAHQGVPAPDPAGQPPPLPETLLRPPTADGVVLLALLQGFEGQIWAAGGLRASRWWPQHPDATAWLNFQRSAGLAAPQTLPAAVPAADLPGRPWAWPRTPQAQALSRRLRQHALAAALALAVVLPALWLVVAGARVQAETARLQAQAQALEAALQPVLAVRADTLQGLAALEQMNTLLDRPAPLPLLAHLAGRWPADGTVLRGLDWDGNQLRLALSVPANRPRVVVIQTLEEGGWLRNVREEAAGEGETGQLVLLADVQQPGPAR